MARRRNYKRDRRGRFSRSGKVAVVPYARANLRSQTVGVNGGVGLGKKRRISAGAYVRVERVSANGVEKRIKKSRLAGGIIKRLAPLSGQVKVKGTEDSYARLGTSRQGLPSVIVRKGKHKTPLRKRSAGIKRYNDSMQKIAEGKRVNKRPERRRKEKR